MSSIRDELTEVARGWRWGRRALTPRDAEPHTPQKEAWSFPTDWARTEAATAVREAILRFGMRPLIESELDRKSVV